MLKVRSLLAAIVACVLLIAGCGGSTRHAQPSSAAKVAARCSPSDYAMGCALHPTRLLGPPLGAAPTAYGIDFAWSCPSPAGHSFGASYLSTDRSKNWTAGCVNWWHSAGAKTVAVWETLSTETLGGYGAGRADALAARGQAAALGNADRPIYFAIDFDEAPGQAGAVAGYFQGVASILGVSRTGAYGSYWAVKRLFDAGLIRYGWQTYAWSGGLWDPRAQLEQYDNQNAVDYDRAIAADYGQFPYAAPKPAPPKPATAPLSLFVDGRFPSPWGDLSERLTVAQYQGAAAHPAKYRGYLHGELAAKLRWLAARDAYVATRIYHSWKPFGIGSRRAWLAGYATKASRA